MQIPDFEYEKLCWSKGLTAVAGIDEVGRGSFAGAVVAGCVVFDKNTIPTFKGGSLKGGRKIIINDSKKLSAKQREIADKWIRENCLACGIGEASVTEINKHGIKKATDVAFRRAIVNCKLQIDHLLIDAFYIPRVPKLPKHKQKPIIKGDSLSFSIAAASIIAKVYRDRLMEKLQNSKNQKLKLYGWGRNKGYGTQKHRDAIKRHGVTKLHRKQFVDTWLSKGSDPIKT